MLYIDVWEMSDGDSEDMQGDNVLVTAASGT